VALTLMVERVVAGLAASHVSNCIVTPVIDPIIKKRVM